MDRRQPILHVGPTTAIFNTTSYDFFFLRVTWKNDVTMLPARAAMAVVLFNAKAARLHALQAIQWQEGHHT